LFWYTAQLQAFHDQVVRGFEYQLATLKDLAVANQRIGRAGINLSSELRSLQVSLERLNQEVGDRAPTRKELAQQLQIEAGERQALQHAFHAQTRAIEELTQQLQAEVADRQALQHALHAQIKAHTELGQRLQSEIAERRILQHSLKAEMTARQDLAEFVQKNSQIQQTLEATCRQAEVGRQHLRAELSGQAARISVLFEETRKKKDSELLDQRQCGGLSVEEPHSLDAFYLCLEDRFRGSRDEIMERQRVYLPFLATQRLGTDHMPVLDLGCGRGEWLELLAAVGLKARGVDTNQIFVDACRKRGLDVTESDAIDHLRGLPSGALGGITGFHIIEHLSLKRLIQLIDETVRVLKPGGLAIFETPNPQNVLVGCHNFYIDPTHEKPLPAVTVQFMLEARGLCDVEILYLHPYAEVFNVRDEESEVASRFNDYFYGPQDYAVIGKRV
jgi:O-antigen chain-terminating methyltransferase